MPPAPSRALSSTIKVLAVDADNVLWLGSAEETSITLTPEFEIFQRNLKRLQQQGMLLVMLTKNDRQAIDHIFRQHPDWPLKLDDFAVVSTGPDDKGERLRRIMKDLNLGLNSCVFVDDSGQERASVARAGDAVVLDVVGSSPSEAIRAGQWRLEQLLIESHWLEGPPTAEASMRTELYRRYQEREQAAAKASSREEFLQTLGLRLSVEIAPSNPQYPAAYFQRAAELSQRTNQFNLTGRRYTAEQLHALATAGDSFIIRAEASDRDHPCGEIGLIVIKCDRANQRWVIDNFCLSCRALRMGIEQAMLYAVADAARTRGAKELLGQVVPTERNGEAQKVYAALGFVDQGGGYWLHPIARALPPPPAWLTVTSGSIRGAHIQIESNDDVELLDAHRLGEEELIAEWRARALRLGRIAPVEAACREYLRGRFPEEIVKKMLALEHYFCCRGKFIEAVGVFDTKLSTCGSLERDCRQLQAEGFCVIPLETSREDHWEGETIYPSSSVVVNYTIYYGQPGAFSMVHEVPAQLLEMHLAREEQIRCVNRLYYFIRRFKVTPGSYIYGDEGGERGIFAAHIAELHKSDRDFIKSCRKNAERRGADKGDTERSETDCSK